MLTDDCFIGHVTGVNTYTEEYEYLLKEGLQAAWENKQAAKYQGRMEKRARF
jgi:hypothetical protein